MTRYEAGRPTVQLKRVPFAIYNTGKVMYNTGKVIYALKSRTRDVPAKPEISVTFLGM